MDYKEVAVFDNYISAHLVLGRLRMENINCWLKDENTVTLDPILTNAVGGIKLLVAEPQKERALLVIKQNQENYQQKNACPQCGSNNIEVVSTPRSIRNWLGTLANIILNVGAPLPIDKVHHCFNCGNEYKIDYTTGLCSPE